MCTQCSQHGGFIYTLEKKITNRGYDSPPRKLAPVRNYLKVDLICCFSLFLFCFNLVFIQITYTTGFRPLELFPFNKKYA